MGKIVQTDFAAWGANVYFTRTVTKNGKVIISDKFVSNYQPWQAVYSGAHDNEHIIDIEKAIKLSKKLEKQEEPLFLRAGVLMFFI